MSALPSGNGADATPRPTGRNQLRRPGIRGYRLSRWKGRADRSSSCERTGEYCRALALSQRRGAPFRYCAHSGCSRAYRYCSYYWSSVTPHICAFDQGCSVSWCARQSRHEARYASRPSFSSVRWSSHRNAVETAAALCGVDRSHTYPKAVIRPIALHLSKAYLSKRSF